MTKILRCLIVLSFLGAYSLQVSAQSLTSDLQYWVPYDQRGLNDFEPDKRDTVGFDGLNARLGADLTMQYQALSHENDAQGVELQEIGPGFNLATANLNLGVQLADGVRMSLVTYLSSRHHPDAWVKGGYLQFDRMPFLESAFVDKLMDKLTLRLGHMEINYGDAHFRRTDNGRAFQNPFIGNYIMDAFTTEIGGELYFKHKGWLAMAAATNGEIKGAVGSPGDRAPSYYGKLGYDKELTDNFRFRLTGSGYSTQKSLNNTLYSGDRAGSRYYGIMSTGESDNFTSGRFSPGFRDRVTALVAQPFVKWGGLEFFANLEQAMGRGHAEEDDRRWQQLGVDLLYRFGEEEDFYIAGRYNRVEGALNDERDALIERVQGGVGFFITENILAKAEYVQQGYNGFPESDMRHGASFQGLIMEGSVSF